MQTRVQQLYYDPNVGVWIYQDLTGIAHGAPPLAEVGPGISSFADAYGEHVCYVGTDEHIHQLFYIQNEGKWVDQDLTERTGGPVAHPLTGISSFADGYGEHVYYMGKNDLHIHQLWFDNINWVDQDLTKLTGGPLALEGYTCPISSFANGYGEHVYYPDIGYEIHQLYFNNIGWADQPLTAWTGGAAHLGDSGISSFADGYGEHVYYIGSPDGHMHQLYFDNIGWADQDLTKWSGGPLPYKSTDISSFSIADSEYVYYVATDQHVHQLCFNNANWNDQDLTKCTGGPLAWTDLGNIAAGISSFGIADGKHVFYVATDLHVHQLYFNNAKWVDQDLTLWSGGPLAAEVFSAISSFAIADGQHAYYLSPQPGS
jgi:hypothetical protein